MNCLRRLICSLLPVCCFTSATAAPAPLAWTDHGTYSSAPLTVRDGRSGFAQLAPDETGIAFTNTVDELSGAANRILYNGCGVAIGDFDGDGWNDIYLCRTTGGNSLYRNLGNWRFEEMAAQAGVRCAGRNGSAAVFADLNGDGRLDLLVGTRGSGVLVFVNNGNGTFTEASASAGTLSPYASVALALADIDGNGTVDLYVGNNRSEDIRDKGQVDLAVVNGKPAIPARYRDRLTLTGTGEILEFGEPDVLLLNNGRAQFTPASWTNGTFADQAGRFPPGPPLDWALCARFHDLNGDGWPDLYVCNDYWTPDRVWINDRTGRFRATAITALRSTSASSMGTDFADIDRDGRDDIFVVDMLSRDPRLRNRQSLAQKPMPNVIGGVEFRPQNMRNTLFRNRGDGTFAEIANFSGVAGSEWSWSPIFLDVDLDGYADVLISAGHFKDVQDLDAQLAIKARQHSWAGFTNAAERQKLFTQELRENMRLYPELNAPIVSYRNLGNGRFEETTEIWGTAQAGVHHGIATGDLDNDGDLDLIVNNLETAAGVYRNESGKPRVLVRLRGSGANTQSIGSRVTLRDGAIQSQSEEITAGGRYLSGSDAVAVFAAGSRPMTLEVRWRSGMVSTWKNIQSNHAYELMEQDSLKRPFAAPDVPPPWFADASASLNHSHRENPFDDFARQPSLPRKLSQAGPGALAMDLNRDGYDDLVIGSGRGGKVALFRNEAGRGFTAMATPFNSQPVARDTAGLCGFLKDDGSAVVVLASSMYEDGRTNGSVLRMFDFGTGAQVEIHANPTPIGPLAIGSVGTNLMLFVGGSAIPGMYPNGAGSQLFGWNGQTFVRNERNTAALQGVGVVNGAVWSDVSGDASPELLLACEWGPIRVFELASGQLLEITAKLGLDQITGLWTGIATGDFDADGRIDIAAGNWGWNSQWKATATEPLTFYYGDLNGFGLIDVIPAEYHEGKRYADCAADSMRNWFPFLGALSFKEISSTPVQELFAGKMPSLRMVQANSLATTVFLNRGDRFEARVLPDEAQYAPVFGPNVADFDGDGAQDIFLAQNFFATRPEIPRLDGGRGLILRGNGKGDFQPVPGQESGVQIYGEQRGSVVLDMDQDGRPELLVTQNGTTTKLLRNEIGRRSLRVQLTGPGGNRGAIGARVRAKTAGGLGPVVEVQAGSGYLSQNSLTPLVSAREPITAISVRWPDGTTSELPVSSNVHTIHARYAR